MSAQQNVDGWYVWYKRRTFPPEAQAGPLEDNESDQESLLPLREHSHFEGIKRLTRVTIDSFERAT
jgi:hypothetical protein